MASFLFVTIVVLGYQLRKRRTAILQTCHSIGRRAARSSVLFARTVRSTGLQLWVLLKRFVWWCHYSRLEEYAAMVTFEMLVCLDGPFSRVYPLVLPATMHGLVVTAANRTFPREAVQQCDTKGTVYCSRSYTGTAETRAIDLPGNESPWRDRNTVLALSICVLLAAVVFVATWFMQSVFYDYCNHLIAQFLQ